MNQENSLMLVGTCDLREDLAEDDVREMRCLLDRHFEGVEPLQFERDLLDKTHVLRVWRSGELVGFSTLLAYRSNVAGEMLNILYSGDTIMSPECWSSPVLARSWIAAVLDIRSSMPQGRCFWLLLSAGFRTYRFLPVFWREFWPRCGCGMPPAVRQLRDGIARERFGACFDPEAGVVRFPSPHRLRGHLSAVPGERLADPHVAFFLDRNPGWTSGDELVCLTEIHSDNLTKAGRRMVGDPVR